MRTKELFDFMRERHSIYVKKESGVPKPWTNDPVLRAYRFCNVYRELDTQTKWIYDCWGKPNKNDKDYWFACVVFRLTNWSETANAIGYPVPWKPRRFIAAIQARKNLGLKVYSGAYTISTNGVSQEKHLYLVDQLNKMWENKEHLRYRKGECLSDFYDRLRSCNAMGSFLAAQVVADMKFCGEARNAKDWWTFVAPGPGSLRGLNRVMRNDKDKTWKDNAWHSALQSLHTEINILIKKYDLPKLSAQDLQNCLCEFDKIERVRLAEGRPRSTYQGI